MSQAGTAPGRPRDRGLARSAVLVGGVTALARGVGFGRQLVFQAAVGPTLLGTLYTTANYVPNIMFEVVAGGALAGTVVPVLAGAVARGDGEAVRRTTAALLGWALLLLVPLALLGALVARPVADALLRETGGADGLDLATRMLLVFLPQVPLYGLAVVTAGVLQAHRRFLAAALAPVLSSLVVCAAYAGFAARFAGDRDDVATVSRQAELLLSAGTTAGVLALALATLVPVLHGRYVARPTLRFPPGTAPKVRALALAGLATVLAQQAALLVLIPLANGQGGPGALVSYQNAWMVYLLPYAVLAVPIATSAFPRLAEHASADDARRFAAVSAGSLRSVLRVAAVGVAVLLATAVPVGRFFARIAPTERVDPAVMGRALVAFAPALLGYAVLAVATRVLMARHDGRAAARVAVIGWVVVALAATVAAVVLPAGWTPAALATGQSVGMSVAGLLALRAVRSCAGPAALAGVDRLAVLAIGAGLGGGALGLVAATAAPTDGFWDGVAGTVLTGVGCAALATAVVAAVLAADRRRAGRNREESR